MSVTHDPSPKGSSRRRLPSTQIEMSSDRLISILKLFIDNTLGSRMVPNLIVDAPVIRSRLMVSPGGIPYLVAVIPNIGYRKSSHTAEMNLQNFRLDLVPFDITEIYPTEFSKTRGSHILVCADRVRLLSAVEEEVNVRPAGLGAFEFSIVNFTTFDPIMEREEIFHAALPARFMPNPPH